MTGWLKLTDAQRKTSIDQASALSGINPTAIEKDWWVTLILKALFQTEFAVYLVFKGGTSLSKCWKLINRFSEDIDIVLDPALFGLVYNDSPTKSQLSRLKKKGCKFTSNKLKEGLERQLLNLGVPQDMFEITVDAVDPQMTDKDPQTLFIAYHSLYEPSPYLPPNVKVEVGVRSKVEPHALCEVGSILYKEFPNDAYLEAPFKVQAVEPCKTFLEKAFLLHEEFQKPNKDKIRVERMSRHFYDLEKLMDTEASEQAFADKELYSTIVEHRSKYNKISGIDYESHHPDTINFMPPAEHLEGYFKDYATMREEMIYGDSLSPEVLFTRISELLGRFRVLSKK